MAMVRLSPSPEPELPSEARSVRALGLVSRHIPAARQAESGCRGPTVRWKQTDRAKKTDHSFISRWRRTQFSPCAKAFCNDRCSVRPICPMKAVL